MTQSVDTEGDSGPPPSDGLTLVGETKRFLQRWQRLMLSTEAWEAEPVSALRQQARELEARAIAADMSGLAHHLQSCEHCFWNGDIDRAKLAHCLRNVSEVAWQWRHDLRRRSELLSLDSQGEVLHAQLTIDAATLLTPPSIELFESSPPPAAEPEPPASDWLAPALGAWQRPSLLSRLLGAVRSRAAGENLLRDAARPAPEPLHEASLHEASLHEPGLTQPGAAAADLGTDRLGYGASLGDTDVTRRSAARRARPRPWWSASVGAAGIAGVGALVWVLGGTRQPLVASPVTGRDAAGQGSARAGEVALPRLPREALERLLGAAHGHGGLESPELAAWLDEEAAELARTGGACTPGAPGCPLVSTARALSVGAPPAAREGAPASWLEGLELPGLGLDDEPLTRQAFEFHTRSAVGRETFQELLLRCAAYREPIRRALGRYGLPFELLALPMAASGCLPDAETTEGARGVWQLSLSAAKAYHLRVKAQLVDERLDPAKSTEAAVRLIEDLHRKLGSWELAIAAQRLGPLALLARSIGAGEDADFDALLQAGTLPDDAVKFVRKVQAFALILANLETLRFAPAPARSAEVTVALEVPPGTRLGLVARAAASSTSKIRELNPGVLGDRVPDWPGERFVLQVPKDAGLRARELLPQLIASSDHADECVPHAFDWGRQRFTPAMASRCGMAGVASP